MSKRLRTTTAAGGGLRRHPAVASDDLRRASPDKLYRLLYQYNGGYSRAVVNLRLLAAAWNVMTAMRERSPAAIKQALAELPTGYDSNAAMREFKMLAEHIASNPDGDNDTDIRFAEELRRHLDYCD